MKYMKRVQPWFPTAEQLKERLTTVCLSVRWRKSQANAVRVRARQHGLTAGEFVRRCALGRLGDREPL